jgi:hypothetical protein
MHLLLCPRLLLFSRYLFAYRRIKLSSLIGDGMTLQYDTKPKLWSQTLRIEKVPAYSSLIRIYNEYKTRLTLITASDGSPCSQAWISEDAPRKFPACYAKQ